MFDEDDGNYDEFGIEDQEDSPHLDEFHEALREARASGETLSYHDWHMEHYGNFGIN